MLKSSQRDAGSVYITENISSKADAAASNLDLREMQKTLLCPEHHDCQSNELIRCDTLLPIMNDIK